MDRITKEFLISEITNVEYHRIGATLTVCAITTKDGFTFTGESACVNPDNFDEELGKRFAHENAFEKMWMPYGFWLNKVLNAHSNLPTNTAQKKVLPKTKRLSFGDVIVAMKEGKRVCREGWNGKGMFLFVVKGETVTKAIEDCYGDPSKKGVHTALDAIYMHTVQGGLVPWLASQTDVLAEDWLVVV